MHRPLDTGLSELKGQLVTMAGLVEEGISHATGAWRQRDAQCIARVYEVEEKVNAAHKQVDKACFQLLALLQPLAVDLRFILSVVKINADLERMVDQAVNIANNAGYYLKSESKIETVDLSKMSDAVRLMARNAIDAFVKSDEKLARAVLEKDDEVDNYKDKIFHDVLQYLKTEPSQIEQGFNVVLIARNLERIGDHATNIAEDVIFTVSGEDIRHSHSVEEEGKK